MFDSYLREHAQQTGQPFVPFSAADYEEYVDGKPRADGTRSFLGSRGIEDLFEARIDGVVAKQEHLRGKPAPDTFLAGARAVGLSPPEAAVFEDALAGVAAGRAGGFGFVVGVGRVGQAEALKEHGADVVVTDLAELMEHR